MPHGTPVADIESIALAKLVELVSRIARDDAVLRRVQAENALRIAYVEQATLTASAIVIIDEAQSGAEVFSVLQVFFDQTSGKGRYTIWGQNPTAAGTGIPIPSGGAQITVEGGDNIKNFKMIAETGATLPYVWLLSK